MTEKQTAVGSRPIPEPIRHDDRGIEEGVPVRPEIQIPMVINRDETMRVVETIHQAAQEVMEAEGIEVPYKVGVMIETPAAARSADTFAGDLQFLSYGVNDLTQTVLAISRDDTVHFMGALRRARYRGRGPLPLARPRRKDLHGGGAREGQEFQSRRLCLRLGRPRRRPPPRGGPSTAWASTASARAPG